MKYIYDVDLNFNNDYYDFYEWNSNDKIINAKRIPIYRVSKEDYLSIKYNNVIINNKLPNMILITNTLEVMGIIIKEGKVIKRSSLLIDEEDEILDSIKDIKITKIDFKRNNYKKRIIVSRNKREKKKYIDLFFKKIDKNNDEYLLRYIYYDLFNKVDNIDNIYNTLLNNCNIDLLYKELKSIEVK